MAPGCEYYEAWVDVYDGKFQVDLWVITAVRDGVVHAVKKSASTWVKVSSKTGDYGWAKHISAWDRKRFVIEKMPDTWARTPAAAYTKALPELEQAIRRLTKLKAQMTGQRTKARTRTAKKKAPPQ